jgi:hypothetical protein
MPNVDHVKINAEDASIQTTAEHVLKELSLKKKDVLIVVV